MYVGVGVVLDDIGSYQSINHYLGICSKAITISPLHIFLSRILSKTDIIIGGFTIPIMTPAGCVVFHISRPQPPWP